MHAVVAGVHRVVAGAGELRCDDGRQRIVDEELQPAAARGSSCSRTASAA